MTFVLIEVLLKVGVKIATGDQLSDDIDKLFVVQKIKDPNHVRMLHILEDQQLIELLNLTELALVYLVLFNDFDGAIEAKHFAFCLIDHSF